MTGLIAEIEQMGGAAAAIDAVPQSQIERNAYRIAEEISSQQRTVVGVNAYTTEEAERTSLSASTPRWREIRSTAEAHAGSARRKAVDTALAAVGAAASGSDNVLYPLKQALASRGTVGEICDVLRRQWGTYESTHLSVIRRSTWKRC